jgi:hypothetical protein
MGGNALEGTQGSIKDLFDILIKGYSLVRERHESFADRAQSLLGFGGIVETILVAIVAALWTDEEAKAALTKLYHWEIFKYAIIIGFILYIISISCALYAWRTEQYKPAPMIASQDCLRDYLSGTNKFDFKTYCFQLFTAIEDYQKRNRSKYFWLNCAACSLAVAIIITALLGIYMIWQS